MDYLKPRQKKQRRWMSKIAIGGLVILLILLIKPTWKIFEKSRENAANLKRAETELAALETRRQELESEINYLKTESGRDQEIRNKFGVVRDGETMVVIVREENETKIDNNLPPPGFFKKTWSGFIGFFGLE